MTKAALIIGGDSTIGAALAARLQPGGWQVHATSRRGTGAMVPLDLAQPPEAWGEMPQADVAYLCAAVTKLDTCEDDGAGTSRINVTHMQALASRLLERGTYVVFLSSNQVFDGRQPYARVEDPVAPLNAYGRQKAEMERWLLSQPAPASVLRLTKVIAARLPILSLWEEALRKGENVKAFTDLVFAPLPLTSALEGLEYLGTHKPRGILQLSGVHDVSYYDVACAFALNLGFGADRVIRASALEAGIRPQFLPPHGTLEVSAVFAGIACGYPLEVAGIR